MRPLPLRSSPQMRASPPSDPRIAPLADERRGTADDAGADQPEHVRTRREVEPLCGRWGDEVVPLNVVQQQLPVGDLDLDPVRGAEGDGRRDLLVLRLI